MTSTGGRSNQQSMNSDTTGLEEQVRILLGAWECTRVGVCSLGDLILHVRSPVACLYTVYKTCTGNETMALEPRCGTVKKLLN
jgi:hypothetical protein